MKKSVLIVAIILVICLAVLISIACVGPRFWMENSLKIISSECSGTVHYAVYGSLYAADKTVNVSQILRKQNKDYSLQEILCVTDTKAYFVYSVHSKTIRNWVIASIDLETENIENHCQFAGAKEPYYSRQDVAYCERNGYYHNGKIVLTDFDSVFIYDILTAKTEECAYVDFEFPTVEVYGQIIDSQAIKVNIQGESRSFTMEQMAKQSKGIAALYGLRDKRIWDGTSCLQGCFSQRGIQTVADRVYVIANCMNLAGESYGIILEYDCQDDLWRYVTHCFSGDNAHGNCYIVPTA